MRRRSDTLTDTQILAALRAEYAHEQRETARLDTAVEHAVAAERHERKRRSRWDILRHIARFGWWAPEADERPGSGFRIVRSDHGGFGLWLDD